MVSADAYRAARHEGAHVAMAEALGWPVVAAYRGRGLTGRTQWIRRTDGDLTERGVECGMILVAPFLIDPIGCGSDAAKLQNLARAGVPLSTIIERAERLMATPEFQRRHYEATNEILSTPEVMSP